MKKNRILCIISMYVLCAIATSCSETHTCEYKENVIEPTCENGNIVINSQGPYTIYLKPGTNSLWIHKN